MEGGGFEKRERATRVFITLLSLLLRRFRRSSETTASNPNRKKKVRVNDGNQASTEDVSCRALDSRGLLERSFFRARGRRVSPSLLESCRNGADFGARERISRTCRNASSRRNVGSETCGLNFATEETGRSKLLEKEVWRYQTQGCKPWQARYPFSILPTNRNNQSKRIRAESGLDLRLICDV